MYWRAVVVDVLLVSVVRHECWGLMKGDST
jgi:hypothetical protein